MDKTYKVGNITVTVPKWGWITASFNDGTDAFIGSTLNDSIFWVKTCKKNPKTFLKKKLREREIALYKEKMYHYERWENLEDEHTVIANALLKIND